MRAFAGIGLVVASEVIAVSGIVATWRLRSRDARARSLTPPPAAAPESIAKPASAAKPELVAMPEPAASPTSAGRVDALTAVLELELADAVLPATDQAPPIPAHVLDSLRTDPLLGLADVRLVQHLQPTGAGLPERSQTGASYQGLNREVARHAAADPVPAARLTWLTMRLELPGSPRRAWADRAAGPMLARGGGLEGARRTLDKAARQASAQLAVAGYRTTALTEADYQPGFRCGLADSRAAAEPAGLVTMPGGVLVGVDPAHRPVVLGLFRRRGLSVAIIGGRYLAEILALRGAAVGARVIVETARPDEWDPVLLHSGLDTTRLVVQPAARPNAPAAWPKPSAATPLLVLRDCGARPPYAAVPRGAWTAVVTLLPYLDPRSAGYLKDADLVGLQRMSREEAAMVRHILGLADKETAALPGLPAPMAMWRSRDRTTRYCELAATQWEHTLLGEPAR
jgi:hypothetical protein